MPKEDFSKLSVMNEIGINEIKPEFELPMSYGTAFLILRHRFSGIFIISAGVILAVTGIAKTWSGFGHAKILETVDPIIGISFRHLMVLAGMLELAVASACFFSARQKLQLGLVAWMSSSIVIYRFGLRWINWHRPCNCLGNLTDALHISTQASETAMKVILGFLFFGSYTLIIASWLQKLTPQPQSATSSANKAITTK